jgi:poly(3-hydroxybutyrate) depolymerase
MTHGGQQMMAIRAMLTALSAGHQGQGPAPSAGITAPTGVEVTDLSDTGAALAWAPVPGATAYRVYRATRPEGPFVLAGSVSGPSFGDSGLMPKTDYLWQVSMLSGSAESSHAAIITGHTHATPASCTDPGNCPLSPN